MEAHSILSGKYFLREKIGNGSFGEVHTGFCPTSNSNIALKIEKNRPGRLYLENEYRILRSLQGGIGIPKVHLYGTEGSSNIMALELLGSSLESQFKLSSHKFSLKTVLMIADQCISRLEFVHTKSFIHRDVKPDNFLVGLRRKSHVIYLIDFGLAKRYIDSNLKHIKYKEGKNLTGTARFASLFTHLGIEQSRRDDLESLGYVLVYFLNGTLPWIGMPGKNKQEKYKQISQVKASKSIEELVQPHPKEFCIYLSYVKGLKFEQKPDYSFLKRIFKELFSRLKFNYDYIFDWDLKRPASPKKNNSVCVEKERGATPIKEFSIRRGLTPCEGNAKKDGKAGLCKTLNGFFRGMKGRDSLPCIDRVK